MNIESCVRVKLSVIMDGNYFWKDKEKKGGVSSFNVETHTSVSLLEVNYYKYAGWVVV